MNKHLKIAGLGLPLLLATGKAEGIEPPATEGSTIRMNATGHYDKGRLGEKQREVWERLASAVKLILLNIHDTVQKCPATKPGVVSTSGTSTIAEGSTPIHLQTLTHYTDTDRRQISSHSVTGFFGIDYDTQLAYVLSEPVSETCFDDTIEALNGTFVLLNGPISCKVHGHEMTDEPLTKGLYITCGPSDLPNATSYSYHFYHKPDTDSNISLPSFPHFASKLVLRASYDYDTHMQSIAEDSYRRIVESCYVPEVKRINSGETKSLSLNASTSFIDFGPERDTAGLVGIIAQVMDGENRLGFDLTDPSSQICIEEQIRMANQEFTQPDLTECKISLDIMDELERRFKRITNKIGTLEVTCSTQIDQDQFGN